MKIWQITNINGNIFFVVVCKIDMVFDWNCGASWWISVWIEMKFSLEKKNVSLEPLMESFSISILSVSLSLSLETASETDTTKI